MKKSLLALAVLGAFAGAASAQTNVTIYGVVDAGIQRSDTNVPGVDARWGLDSGIQSGSRLGFRGTEDLGGGLSAIFTLENGFDVDTGALGQGGLMFGRQAFVGLKGGFGAVKLGRQNTPIHIALDSIDPFETGLAGNVLNVFNNYGTRMNNTINYSLPNMGGVFGELAYGLGEIPGENSRNRHIGLSVGYANGPVRVLLSHHTRSNGTAAAAETAEPRTTLIGGTFDFRVAKAHAAFAVNKGDFRLGEIVAGYVPGATSQAITAASEAAGFNEAIETRDLMLGVSAPVGAGSVLATWARKDDRNSDAQYDVFAVGYVHNVSKRTNLYTSFGHGRSDNLAVPGIAGDVKNNVLNVGVRHRF